jgi:hypothetical protein
MRVHVDFSVFTVGGEALGYVDGEIDCIVEPLVGDTICLMLSPDGVPIPTGHAAGGLLKVMGRVIRPNEAGILLSLSLENIVVDTREHGFELMEYLDSSYKLFSNLYERP